jgi:hypothetical protein
MYYHLAHVPPMLIRDAQRISFPNERQGQFASLRFRWIKIYMGSLAGGHYVLLIEGSVFGEFIESV